MVAKNSYVEYFAAFKLTEEWPRADKVVYNMWISSRVKVPPGSVIVMPKVS